MIIDSLSSGGAQRQFCYLATGLQTMGFEVDVVCYNDWQRHFSLDGIVSHVTYLPRSNSTLIMFKKIFTLRNKIRKNRYSSVISFQTSAGILSSLSILGFSQTPLLVCERNSRLATQSWIRKILMNLSFCIATKIITNSADRSKGIFVGFKKKVCVIFNGYDIELLDDRKINLSTGIKKLAIIGRLDLVKNPFNIIKALKIFYKNNGYLPEINWYGRYTNIDNPKLKEKIFSLVSEDEILQKNWKWHGVIKNVQSAYDENDCLLHVSLHEGTPNVVCEAMLYHCPVIASNVCDNPHIIEDGVDGILCEPLDAFSIYSALERFRVMSDEKKINMVTKARTKITEKYNLQGMIDKYVEILNLCCIEKR